VVLKRIHPTSLFMGYFCTINESEMTEGLQPIKLKLLPKVRERDTEEIDLILKYQPRLKKLVRESPDSGSIGDGGMSLSLIGDKVLKRDKRKRYSNSGGTRIQFTRVQPVMIQIEEELGALVLMESESAMALHEVERNSNPDANSNSSLALVNQSPLLGDSVNNPALALGDVFSSSNKDIERVEDDPAAINSDSERSLHSKSNEHFSDQEEHNDTNEDFESNENIDSTNFSSNHNPSQKTRPNSKIHSKTNSKGVMKSREYIISRERLVHEFGAKINFKDRHRTWQGYAAIKVYEGSCWTPSIGSSKRLRFTVFEPILAKCFEGMILNTAHLRRVLGTKGKDLLVRDKQKEMLLYIARFRLLLVKPIEELVEEKDDDERELSTLGDGGDTINNQEQKQEEFRVDFVSEIIYSTDKVTPVNFGPSGDGEANETKLFLSGKKQD
jgi:hypothetical protein